MSPAEAARRWAAAWKRGWEALDAEPILACYAADALLSTEPFREPYRGRDGVREYVTGVFAVEAEPRVWMSAPIVDAERAAVAWWSSLREEEVDTTLAGVSLLRFDAEALVVEQWDAWSSLAARRDPPPTWGPFGV